MSSVILTNWTVYYQSDAGTAGQGSKQIRWTGTTGTNTVNELYSSLMDLFDNASQNDAEDSIPMRAVTPTLYEIGSSDAGDRRPWFIDPDSISHLTGGGLNTDGWTRDLSARTGSHGIYKITRTTTNLTSNDVGRTYTTSGTATGWILHVSGNNIWVRPTDGTATHDMSGITSITANSVTDTITSSATATAECICANIYTLGSLESATNIYIYQNGSPITPWWPEGHIDILVVIQDFGNLIDDGQVTLYARQYTKLYDHYSTNLASGGRTPIPIATAPDANNPTGYRTFTGTGGSGTFNVGNFIYVGTSWVTATKKGVLTAVASYTLTYYLVGDFTDFAASDAVKEYIPNSGTDGDGTCTAGTPTNVGPTASPSTTLTIAFGGTNQDLNNGSGLAPYSVILDLQDNIGVAELYERLKYLTRRGQTTDIDTQTSQAIIGQSYTGIGDYYIPYDTGSVDNPFTEGETLTTAGGFSGTLTSKHDRGTSEGFLIVRDVRGTLPVDNDTLTGSTSAHTALVDTNTGTDPVSAIAQLKVSPFGTFAGGKFFGARGVWLANVPAADANNYELIDSTGITQSPPNTIAITINGVNTGDKVSVFRTTGNNEIIDRAIYTSDATANTLGLGTFTVQEPIATDTPPSGMLRVVNNTINDEDLYAYSSWSGSTFTLNGVTLVDTYTDADTAYVPFIQTTSGGSSVSQAVTYTADRYVLVVVRAAGTIPFKVAGQVTSSGLALTAIRTTDSIYQ